MPSSFYSIPEAGGLFLNESTAFADALSAAPAGSVHYPLFDGQYAVWATAPFALFVTDAANDPPTVPTTQSLTLGGWPGALVNTGQILLFQFDSRVPVTVNAVPNITPTGIRLFRITGTAGVFYLTEFRRKLVSSA